MSTEIDQTEDVIIGAVKAAFPQFAVVDSWPDGKDLDRLLDEALSLPACYVIMAHWSPGEQKVIGGNTSDQEMHFRLAVLAGNMRSDKDGSREAYELVTGVMALLKRFSVTPLRGYLWPAAPAELLMVKNGCYAYGLEFSRRYTA